MTSSHEMAFSIGKGSVLFFDGLTDLWDVSVEDGE